MSRLVRKVLSTTGTRAFGLALVFAGVSLLSASTAEARAPGEPVPSFIVLPEQSGEVGCLPRTLAQKTLQQIVLEENRARGIDPRIAIVFSFDVPTCSDLFYVPVANDVRGIGYQHVSEHEVFDESPNSNLEGIAFLNDYPYWQSRPAELRRSFLHEVGHRYGVRVHVAGDEPKLLLGRQNQHYSFFSNTAGSPLGGNVFVETPSGVRTETHLVEPRYGELDLYLMGLLPADQVSPFFVVVPEELDAVDCQGGALSADSRPAWCDEIPVAGRTLELTVDDVISVEGKRDPAASDASRVLTVGYYFLLGEAEMSVRQCEAAGESIEELSFAFQRATDDRMLLEVLTSLGASCASAEIRSATSSASATRGCAWTGPARRQAGTFRGTAARTWVGGAVLIWLLRRRKRRGCGPARSSRPSAKC